MPADRACNAYLFAIREHADEERIAWIEEALQPPINAKNSKGVPTWYGDDDDAWETWQRQV